MDSIQNSSTIPTIRIAEKKDASALLDIYAPYVTDTAITFEYEIPSVEEFANRIEHTLKRYPYLIAEEERYAGRLRLCQSVSMEPPCLRLGC